MARLLGVDKWTVINWLKDRAIPAVRNLPVIIEFLGCNPFPVGDTFPKRLRTARQVLGLSQKALARR